MPACARAMPAVSRFGPSLDLAAVTPSVDPILLYLGPVVGGSVLSVAFETSAKMQAVGMRNAPVSAGQKVRPFGGSHTLHYEELSSRDCSRRVSGNCVR